jgi:4-amino-4-deoxy-L-arabinose transferase-like glycosyltransferase
VQTKKLPVVFLFCGVTFALASLQVGRDLPTGTETPIWILVGMGVLMSLVAIYAFLGERTTTQLENLIQHPSNWFGISTWRFPLLISGLLFSILAHYAAGEDALMYSPFFGWMAWIIAILFIIAGGWQRGSLNLAAFHKILLVSLGFIVLGYLVRGFAPEHYPLIFYGDEASCGLIGLDILAGKFNNPFTMGWASFPSLYFFIPAGSIAIFGPTLAALRIPSIIAGSLAVGATYLTVHAMYGKHAGLLTALLVAGFPIHIHFSRIGLSNVWDGMFYIAVLGAVWYAWERENRNAFLLAGFGLGISQYFYVTSHTLLILIPAWLVLVSLCDRTRFKRLLPGIALMVLSALVVVLPFAWYSIRNPEQFFAPMVRAEVFNESFGSMLKSDSFLLWQTVFERIWAGTQSFTSLPMTNVWFPSGATFLGVPLAELFLIGLVFLIFNLRESRNILVGMCLVLFIFIGGLSENPPAPQRYVAVIPVCLMVIAFGLNKMTAILERTWTKIAHIFTPLVLLLCMALFLKNALSYYFDYTPVSTYFVAESNEAVAQHLGEFLQTQPDDTQVVFFGVPRMGFYSIASLPYLVPKTVGLDMLEPWGSQLNPKPDSSHLVFVFLPQNAAEIPLVQGDYPGGKLFEEMTYRGKILYYYYLYEE